MDTKQLIGIFLILVIIVLLTFQGNSNNENNQKESTTVVSTEISDKASLISNNGTNDKKTNNSESIPSIAKTVVCDNEIAKITVQRLAYDKSFDTYVILLSIENKAEKTISYSTNWINIDGFTFGASTFGDIYSGMHADVSIGIEKDEVDLAEISPMRELQFSIELRDKEANENIYSVPVVLHTSAYSEERKASDFSFIGDEIYNEGGIIISARLNDNPTVRKPLIVYIENNSNNAIMVNYNDVAINDTMVAEMMSGPYVLANTKRITEMSIFYFGDEPEINEIESVTLSMSILTYENDGSFSTENLINTKPATISAD